jgi:hypothetical protein
MYCTLSLPFLSLQGISSMPSSLQVHPSSLTLLYPKANPNNSHTQAYCLYLVSLRTEVFLPLSAPSPAYWSCSTLTSPIITWWLNLMVVVVISWYVDGRVDYETVLTIPFFLTQSCLMTVKGHLPLSPFFSHQAPCCPSQGPMWHTQKVHVCSNVTRDRVPLAFMFLPLQILPWRMVLWMKWYNPLGR